jgi:hypothetical protein
VDLEPIVQIVHYSDIHLRGKGHSRQRLLLERAKRWLPQEYQQGLASADRQALSAFEHFLHYGVASDPAWRGQPIWLVDTGDGTTFGDDESMREWAVEWTGRFKRAAGTLSEHLMLYGNHDAWPGTFPAFAPTKLETQRDSLRRKWFKHGMPRSPLSAPIPGTTSSRVELYVANTVDHRLLPAIFNWGWAAPDLRWETGHRTSETLTDHLEHWSRTFPDSGQGQHFRILATHYPVCSAVQEESIFKILRNREALARDLARPGRVSQPFMHLLLAGHTHEAYPAQGSWPSSLSDALHEPLANGSCQLVSASLSQAALPSDQTTQAVPAEDLQSVYPHQCTLLRIYRNAGGVPSLMVERIVVGRAGSGSFGYLPMQADSASYAEHMAVSLAA